MPRPLVLTDAELSAVMTAARPLQPRDRDAFLQHLARVLGALPPGTLGIGAVHRAIASIWREHFDAPSLTNE